MFFLWRNINLIHMLDPIQYEFLILFTTLADPELGAGADTSIFQLQLRFRSKVPAPAPQHCVFAVSQYLLHPNHRISIPFSFTLFRLFPTPFHPHSLFIYHLPIHPPGHRSHTVFQYFKTSGSLSNNVNYCINLGCHIQSVADLFTQHRDFSHKECRFFPMIFLALAAFCVFKN